MKTKILSLILCFFMIKANAQELSPGGGGNICELINNGGFETGATCGIMPPNTISPPYGAISNWQNQLGTPDIFITGTCGTDPNSAQFELGTRHTKGSNATTAATLGTVVNPYSGNNIIGLERTTTENEAFMQQMQGSLQPQKVYTITFYAKLGDYSSLYAGGTNTNLSSNISLYAGTSSNIPTPDNNGVETLQYQASNKGLTFLTNVRINVTATTPTVSTYDLNNPWTKYTATFTFNGTVPSNYIYIGSGLENGQVGNYTYLDDISIVETPNVITGVTTICIGNTTTLSSLPTATGGTGTWSSNSNNATVNSSTGVVTGVSVGNAVITYKLPNHDGCTVQIQTTVTVQACYQQCTTNSCNSLSSTIAGNYTNTKYCPTTDLTVGANGTATFTNCEIVMQANTKIIVPSRTTLKLYGCHLYSCDAMWLGIDVQPGGVLIVDGFAANSSFIEDAKTAINYTVDIAADAINNNKTLTFFVNNTIFNRNYVGINLVGNSNNPSRLNASLINIGNCLFTSRNITFGTLSWATMQQIKQSTVFSGVYPTVNNTLIPPYITDVSYPDNLVTAYLKSPYAAGSTKPSAGIVITNELFAASHIAIGTATGTSSDYKTTLFDNLEVGINITSSSLDVANCSFQKGWLNPATNAVVKGYGIFAANCGISQNLNITTAIGKPRNAFWNMQYAVKTSECYNVLVNNADIQSKQTLATYGTNLVGKWGIFVQGVNYNSISISNNKITNIANGIKVDNVSGAMKISNYIGVVSNTITSDFSATATTPYTGNINFVETAISLSSTNKSTNANVDVSCLLNHLYSVFNGILVSGWNGKYVSTQFSDITLKQYTKAQYGISYTGNTAPVLQDKITNNTIKGDCNTCQQTGIYVAGQTNGIFVCNSVYNNLNGFKFFNINSGIQFTDNFMYKSNKYGFTLDNNAQIGTQGSLTCTSDNWWEGKNSDWTTPSLLHYRIGLSNGTDALKSKLYVKTTLSDNYNPDLSAIFSITSSNNLYTTTPGATQSLFTNGSSGNCSRCTSSGSSFTNADVTDISILEDIAKYDASLANTPDEADAILASQQQLYEMLKNDPGLLDQSSTLQQFMADNNWSTIDYGYLTALALADGNINLTNALLNTWTTEGTPDFNSYTFYTWLYNMQVDNTYLPDTTAVLAMAVQCPITGGRIVYAARNLYNTLTEQNILFDENCESTNAMGRQTHTQKPTKHNNKQETTNILVYPNPTTGYIYIDLPNTEKTCWQITVTDVYGKRVAEKSLRTNAGKTFINIRSAVTGMYFVNVLNCTTGKQEVTKVILQ